MHVFRVKANLLYLNHAVPKSRNDKLSVRIIPEVMLDGQLNRELCLRRVAGKETCGRVKGLMLKEPPRAKIRYLSLVPEFVPSSAY